MWSRIMYGMQRIHDAFTSEWIENYDISDWARIKQYPWVFLSLVYASLPENLDI